MEYTKFFIFPFLHQFELKRDEVHGGDVIYKTYEELEKDFVDLKVYPLDLKKNFASQLNTILEPIRVHFKTDPHARQIFQKTKQYQAQDTKYKLEISKKKKKAQQAKEKARKQKEEKAKKEKEQLEKEQLENPEKAA